MLKFKGNLTSVNDAMEEIMGSVFIVITSTASCFIRPIRSHLRQPPLLLLDLPLLGRLHALRCNELRVPDLLKVLLVRTHGRQFLLLKDLHQALLQDLAHKDLKDRLHLKIKVEQVAWEGG